VIATPHWLIEAGTNAGIITAMIAAAVALLKSPIGHAVRWVWGRLFGEPITAWLRRTTRESVAEDFVRLWSGLEVLRRENSMQHNEARGERIEQHKELSARLDDLHQRVVNLEIRMEDQ
jgi:hypothetical protein